MSVGDDFHGAENAAEKSKLPRLPAQYYPLVDDEGRPDAPTPWKTVDIFLRDFPPRYREEVAELRERLRVRTELLEECREKFVHKSVRPDCGCRSCVMADKIDAELALDAKEPTP